MFTIFVTQFQFFFKEVNLLEKFRSEALADARNIRVLTIFHAFSSSSALMAKRLPATFQNLF
jgi:hypothetical protein